MFCTKPSLTALLVIGIASAQQRLSDYVDLLIGTEGPTPGSGIAGGNAFPGAALPWGMAKAGIDTSFGGLPSDFVTDCNAGYSPLGNVTGVSMMHVSGTGGNPTYGFISQMPLLGTLDDINLADNNTYAQNRSLSTERAVVGSFTTTLLNGIQINITSSKHSSIIRYGFPDSDAHILVDLTHVLPALEGGTQSYTQQYYRGDLHIRTGSSGQASYYGFADYGGGWPNQEITRYFFCANFSTPENSALVPTDAYVQAVGLDRVKGAGTFSWPFNIFEPPTDRPPRRSDTDIKSSAGNKMGLAALFSWTPSRSTTGNILETRVGISHVSVDNACGYIQTEVPASSSFEDIVEQSRQQWETNVLSSVEVVDDGSPTSGNTTLKRMLYTALYQAALMPTDKTGEIRTWTSNESFPAWDDFYTLWDTYRTVTPLYHLLFTGVYSSVIKGLVNIFSFEGYLPAGRAANFNGRVQGGTHADLVLGDAFVKSYFSPTDNITGLNELGDIDWNEAYAAMLKDGDVLPDRNADMVAFDGGTKEGRGALDDYLSLHYITRNKSRSIARGLEYSQDDFAILQVASGLAASTEDQARYLARSTWWENQWNPQANVSLRLGSNNITFRGFAGPRNADGTFNFTDYNPVVCTPSCGWSDDIYEATVWATSFTAAPHDMSRLITLMGGDDAFIQRLDASFVPGLGTPSGNPNNDAGTALFNPGNEPSFTTPFLYDYVPGYHWRTVNQSRATVDRYYDDTRSGYPGNIDSGALPTWLIFNLLGLYPITGQSLYLLGAPRFSSLRVRLFGGTALERTLAIKANGLADNSFYPQKVTLDGKELDRAWLSHSELVGATELVFEMGPEPARWDTGKRPWSLTPWPR